MEEWERGIRGGGRGGGGVCQELPRGRMGGRRQEHQCYQDYEGIEKRVVVVGVSVVVVVAAVVVVVAVVVVDVVVVAVVVVVVAVVFVVAVVVIAAVVAARISSRQRQFR